MTDKRERFTLRLPRGLFEQLKNEANKTGVSVNAFILKILWEWVEKKNDMEN